VLAREALRADCDGFRCPAIYIDATGAAIDRSFPFHAVRSPKTFFPVLKAVAGRNDFDNKLRNHAQELPPFPSRIRTGPTAGIGDDCGVPKTVLRRAAR
jgi:hypothetical protein